MDFVLSPTFTEENKKCCGTRKSFHVLCIVVYVKKASERNNDKFSQFNTEKSFVNYFLR